MTQDQLNNRLDVEKLIMAERQNKQDIGDIKSLSERLDARLIEQQKQINKILEML